MNTSHESIARRTMTAGAAGAAGAMALSSCAREADEVPPVPDAVPVTLAKLADVPVGGAISVPGPDGLTVVVAQPEPGTVKAFDAACTHKGCPVKVDDTQLRCPCHGSSFEAATGAVLSGPATRPLTPVATHVDERGNVHKA